LGIGRRHLTSVLGQFMTLFPDPLWAFYTRSCTRLAMPESSGHIWNFCPGFRSQDLADRARDLPGRPRARRGIF
jgi:hypothetical protein